jgi:hypothetical protein
VTDDDKDLEELFAPLRESARNPVDHPTPEELEAYHAKELSPEEEERIREHLVACRECADLMLDLQSLYAAANQPETGVADFEQATAWRDLREKLPFRPEPIVEPAAPEPRRRAALRPAWGLAALLAIVILGGLVYRTWWPGTPRGEAQVTTLDPSGSFRSGEPGIEIETVPRSNEIVLRVDGPSYPGYVAEIRQGGREVKTLTGLREDEPLNVPLGALGSSLEPGEYEIVLFSLQGDHRKKAGTYQVRFEAP